MSKNNKRLMIQCRITQEEYDAMHKKMKELNLDKESEYVRKALKAYIDMDGAFPRYDDLAFQTLINIVDCLALQKEEKNNIIKEIDRIAKLSYQSSW